MVRGVWRLSGQRVLLIMVYAPQESSEKQMLWDFLKWEISKWNGDVVIMGDFNEVRFKSDRLILVVVLSRGATSLLPRWRYLSDHRPILLRELNVDYGPSPFRFFHYWIEMEGFCKIVEDGWKESPCDNFNAMRNPMGKLKHVKKVIRIWNKSKSLCDSKDICNAALNDVEARIDNGHATEEDVKKRAELISRMCDIDKLKSMEMAQKIKVKWAVDGDENSSFFHGILNTKRNTQNIRGIMVNGNWEEKPDRVKSEFVDHFRKRFCSSDPKRVTLQMNFPNIITLEQQSDMEGDVSNAEIKNASAFIADRQILDGPFILNEVLQWCKVKKKQALVLKACLKSSRGSIIINGSPTEEFQFGKGLKKGDPIAPFLFILIMESLHLSFQRVVDAGLFHGFQLGGSANLSHMFYADDAVFVGQWSEGNIKSLVHVLETFNLISGLKINMRKSKIMGVHVNSNKVNMAAQQLGCLVLKAPFIYLGSMVGGIMSKTNAWNDVVDKVRNRLSKWKMKMLSIGGRLTLLKSVLGSMPIYRMSMFKVPTGVLNSLENIRCQFFNGHEYNGIKASWVKWKMALTSKEIGGLGVSSLYALNRGLLIKWLWRFYSNDSSLWTRVIKAIHGVDGKVDSVIKACNRSCWLNIVREVDVLKNRGIDIKSLIHIKIGDGTRTVFWEDIWNKKGRLKNLFPRLYALETSKAATVETKIGNGSVTDSFRRLPRGGAEQQQLEEMLTLVNSISLVPMADKMYWDLDSAGDFSVASVRKMIDDRWLPRSDSKTRWINYIPIKINVLAWKIMSNAIPSRFNISKRALFDQFTGLYLSGGTFLRDWMKTMKGG
nr:RNA-directed DNA polymerase, eukaryota, reverse transcriptase zinc-binding domain protein [Tanacetum cinerariifolium]